MKPKMLKDNKSLDQLIENLEKDVRDARGDLSLNRIRKYCSIFISLKGHLYGDKTIEVTVSEEVVFTFFLPAGEARDQQTQDAAALSIPFSEILDVVFAEYKENVEGYLANCSPEELHSAYDSLHERINALIKNVKRKAKNYSDNRIEALFWNKTFNFLNHELKISFTRIGKGAKKNPKANTKGKKGNGKVNSPKESKKNDNNHSQAFTWHGQKDEIRKLFEVLKKNHAIHEDDEFEDFEKIYSSDLIPNPVKIRWNKRSPKNENVSSTPSLIALHECLMNKGKIKGKTINEIFVKRLLCFFADCNGDDIVSPKDKLRNYNGTKPPANKDWAESIVANL